ncbi:TrbI/VirB10 family protein [Vibrio brasiliensis]|uniref:TrbI/VirB10 family protein n=1 Tax=Vibrio brasiliensis TaxID=170652 RepID=UPI0030B8CA72
MMFASWKKRVLRDAQGEFEQGDDINRHTAFRNGALTLIVVIALLIFLLGLYQYTRPPEPDKTSQSSEPAEFGAIIEQGFVEKDNQSALTLQQHTLSSLRKHIADLEENLRTLQEETQRDLERAKEETTRLVEDKVRKEYSEREAELEARIQAFEQAGQTLSEPMPDSTTDAQDAINEPEVFGTRPLPPRPAVSATHNPDMAQMQYPASDQRPFKRSEFDSHDFIWDTQDEERDRRTTDNYVPTGTFVTAVVTGGADANAGVLGQGDTTPVVFQTVHEGILPNGDKSRLKDCTITAAAYGEVSSSRGIVRTHRLSCIQDNGHILDVAVKGTAFNFGRNGIRGTTILKNGDIVQMAGIAGILTGIGETGKALSQTTTTSPLGSTTTLSGKDSALNLLGNATASVGAKLSDYYIGLAELYHPIVEINPGAVVNIVFLEGFPLDPVKAEDYERAQAAQEQMSSQSNQILDVITNTPLNPLAGQLSKEGIDVPATPFGR